MKQHGQIPTSEERFRHSSEKLARARKTAKLIHAQPAGDGIRMRTAPTRERPPVVRRATEGSGYRRVEFKQAPTRPPAQTTTEGMRGDRRWVSHAARAFGIRQLEPRREEASPDRDILQITTPETLESTVQESQTHVDQEIASSSQQTADPRSPPVARQTEPELMINELGWRDPVDVTISSQATLRSASCGKGKESRRRL